MAKGREVILQSYSVAAQKDPTLTPAEHMMMATPGENEVHYRGKIYYTTYKNSDSAARAWRRVYGETSRETGRRRQNVMAGERLYQRSLGIRARYKVGRTPSGEPIYEYRQEPRLGGGQAGMWQVTVDLQAEDMNGNVVIEQRSFTMFAGEEPGRRSTYMASQLVGNDQFQDEVQAHADYWATTSPPKTTGVVLSQDEDGAGIVLAIKVSPIVGSSSRTPVHLTDVESFGEPTFR